MLLTFWSNISKEYLKICITSKTHRTQSRVLIKNLSSFPINYRDSTSTTAQDSSNIHSAGTDLGLTVSHRPSSTQPWRDNDEQNMFPTGEISGAAPSCATPTPDAMKNCASQSVLAYLNKFLLALILINQETFTNKYKSITLSKQQYNGSIFINNLAG